MQNSPLLSVIIPTKNRNTTLFPVLASLIKYIDSIDIEFIIQDNSDNNIEIDAYIKSLQDSRVKYFYQKKTVSIQQNTIFSIENSNGKYLIFIGDDDLVSPKIKQIVDLMEAKDIDCLIYEPAKYWWTNVKFKTENFYFRPGVFWLPKNIKNSVIIEIDTKKEFDYFLKRGCVSSYRLPRLYHGIVKREILDEIKNKTGTFLSGASPDISFSAALSLILHKHYVINYPVSVYGASNNSGGGFTASKKHYGKIEDQKFLPEATKSNWNINLPTIWSEHTIYPQSVYEVLKSFYSPLEINYISFYSSMLVYESYLFSYIYPKLKLIIKNSPFKLFLLLKEILKRIAGKNITRFKLKYKLLNYNISIHSSIEECMLILNKLKF